MKFDAIEATFAATDDGKSAIARGGMVATAFPEATRAGVEMLAQGGNAIDAACAAAFALAVCEPQASGLGGQTLAIVHLNGRTFSVDGSSRAPSLAHLSRITDREELFTGQRGTTVPSTPATLDYLNHRYGKLPMTAILAPAIRIAREGYAITALQHRLLVREAEKFALVPNQSGTRYFFRADGEPYAVGEIFRQPDLAAMLEHLSRAGVKAFYLGEIAAQIDADMRANGGFLSAEDLALIPWPIERPCIARKYRGLTVHTLPPPGAGQTLLLVLMMLGFLPRGFLRAGTPASFHFLAETFRKAFRQRKRVPVDPNVFLQVSEKKLTSRKFAKSLVESIRDGIDSELPLIEPPPDDLDTTHLSVMDAAGNAVGITQSIERVYGAKCAAEGLGFLYNNYMTRFEMTDPTNPYYLRPNAVPWSTVAPSIVAVKGEPWLVVGSPGSERIFSTISLFLSHLVDGGQTMTQAMMAPRLHCSTGGTISYESERFDPAVIEYLTGIGYKMDAREPFAFFHGAIHAVMKCRTRAEFHGVAEVRRDGIAQGSNAR